MGRVPGPLGSPAVGGATVVEVVAGSTRGRGRVTSRSTPICTHGQLDSARTCQLQMPRSAYRSWLRTVPRSARRDLSQNIPVDPQARHVRRLLCAGSPEVFQIQPVVGQLLT